MTVTINERQKHELIITLKSITKRLEVFGAISTSDSRSSLKKLDTHNLNFSSREIAFICECLFQQFIHLLRSDNFEMQKTVYSLYKLFLTGKLTEPTDDIGSICKEIGLNI